MISFGAIIGAGQEVLDTKVTLQKQEKIDDGFSDDEEEESSDEEMTMKLLERMVRDIHMLIRMKMNINMTLMMMRLMVNMSDQCIL